MVILALEDCDQRILPLAKWGWRFTKEYDFLWSQVVKSIHGSSLFGWHTNGKVSCSLHSPWIGISRTWLKVEALAIFKIGNGRRVAFWLDPWVDRSPLKVIFPRLYKISLNPNGAVSDYWDSSHSLWSITFRRLLKEEEIVDFQTLLGLLTAKSISANTDKHVWELEANGNFSVKSLVTHLSRASPIGKLLECSLWKTKSP